MYVGRCRRVPEHVDGGDEYVNHANSLGAETVPCWPGPGRDVGPNTSSAPVLVGSPSRQFSAKRRHTTQDATIRQHRISLHQRQTHFTSLCDTPPVCPSVLCLRMIYSKSESRRKLDYIKQQVRWCLLLLITLC